MDTWVRDVGMCLNLNMGKSSIIPFSPRIFLILEVPVGFLVCIEKLNFNLH